MQKPDFPTYERKLSPMVYPVLEEILLREPVLGEISVFVVLRFDG